MSLVPSRPNKNDDAFAYSVSVDKNMDTMQEMSNVLSKQKVVYGCFYFELMQKKLIGIIT